MGINKLSKPKIKISSVKVKNNEIENNLKKENSFEKIHRIIKELKKNVEEPRTVF